MRPDDLAHIAAGVVSTIKTSIAPVHERIAAIDASIESRVAVLVSAAELGFTRELGTLRERVVALETRPPLPGPPGPEGPPGRDGKDGESSIRYKGRWCVDLKPEDGTTYRPGDMVTFQGSIWHCNELHDYQTARPGESSVWVLMVKRGKDGKDAAKGPH
jgi:hypothetical protein